MDLEPLRGDQLITDTHQLERKETPSFLNILLDADPCLPFHMVRPASTSVNIQPHHEGTSSPEKRENCIGQAGECKF
jgi:hypothetical protein